MLRNIGNESIFKTNTADKSRTFNQYFDVSFWENLFLKYMNTRKNVTNLVQVVNAHSASRNARNLVDSFETDLI